MFSMTRKVNEVEVKNKTVILVLIPMFFSVSEPLFIQKFCIFFEQVLPVCDKDQICIFTKIIKPELDSTSRPRG